MREWDEQRAAMRALGITEDRRKAPRREQDLDARLRSALGDKQPDRRRQQR